MALRIAAHMLEANEADLDIVDARVEVRGTPTRSVALADVARAAWFAPSSLPDGLRQGLEATCDYRVPRGGWTAATHSAVVEVDTATGHVDILRYLVVEDCGTLINPAIVGGVAQGIAQVLYERHTYDADGQLLTSSLADYLVPSAADLPSIDIDHLEVDNTGLEDTDGQLDARGVGEGGMIGAPAALCNAVSDALSPFGVDVEEQYLSPENVLRLIGKLS
jgi:carbon-monoxide dehydrogenase large subunit